MEELKAKSSLTGKLEHTEDIAGNEEEKAEDSNEIKNDEADSPKEGQGDVICIEKDNLKGVETPTPNKSEKNAANSVNKGEKSDSTSFHSCSAGNTSKNTGTATVIRTGNSSLNNLLVYSSESSDSSDSESSSSESESYESPEVSDK